MQLLLALQGPGWHVPFAAQICPDGQSDGCPQ
jgi:hypothetical protein